MTIDCRSMVRPQIGLMPRYIFVFKTVNRVRSGRRVKGLRSGFSYGSKLLTRFQPLADLRSEARGHTRPHPLPSPSFSPSPPLHLLSLPILLPLPFPVTFVLFPPFPSLPYPLVQLRDLGERCNPNKYT